MHQQLLHRDWTVKAVGDLDPVPAELRDRLAQGIPAAVPGCVHTDLLNAQLIPDPYVGLNENDLQWIGWVDWQFTSTFIVERTTREHPRIDLVCEGLDTVATVEINGNEIGRSENMHHPHRFDVTDALVEGDNTLTVTFHSAEKYCRQWQEQLGALPYVKQGRDEASPFNFIRKNACNFGWDWGPSLVTCGFWKPIYLQGWGGARIDHVRPLVSLNENGDALVDIHADLDVIDAAGQGKLIITLTEPDGATVATHEVDIIGGGPCPTEQICVGNPKLWWPHGHGDQPLHRLDVTLVNADGDELDTWSRRIGLRGVELETSPDDFGHRFVIKVNGKELFCKGANWIPDDTLLPRACEPPRVRQRIQQAIDCNMNMLRIWGGGIFETDDFYDICDELGVMVWQDFLFACAAYPEEEPFRSLVEDEARYNIARLASHPSLVIWNGCNENLWGYCAWGWQANDLCKDRTWGPGYYLDLLPRLLSELDTSRPYWPASPFSGEWPIVEVGKPFVDGETPVHTWNTNDRSFGPEVKGERPGNLTTVGVIPNDEHHGNKHVWEAWFGEEYSVYRTMTPRFCSEFGFQAPATFATMQRALGDDALHKGSEALAHHQKSPRGDHHNDRHLEAYFEMPEDFDDWQYLLQLNQARALTLGVEWFRSQSPRCMGALYWQLNDCWPVTSWAAIDGDQRPKPLWYATRRFFAPRLLTIQPHEGGLAVHAINDTLEPWKGNLAITRTNFIGRPQYAGRADVKVEPGGNQCIPITSESLITPADPAGEFITVNCDDQQAFWFFQRDRDIAYLEPDFDAHVERDGDTYRLAIQSHVLMRDVAIFVDRLDPEATISDQLITLMPEEPVQFIIHSKQALDTAALTSPPVLQCANRFGRK